MKKRKFSDNKMHRCGIFHCGFATRTVIKDYSGWIDATASYGNNDAISTFLLMPGIMPGIMLFTKENRVLLKT